MSAQIVDHQTVLNLLDTRLIFQAQDPAVRALLVIVRPIIADHLTVALAIQARLGVLG
jgi:predicted outer membrane protein